MFLFWKCLQWSCLEAVSVPTFVTGDLLGSTATSALVRCPSVTMITLRRWADVGLWVAVCALAKISLRRPRTTFAYLTQSQAISQSIAFSSLSDQREIRTSFTSLIFSILFFYRFLYNGDQMISWWRICRWLAVKWLAVRRLAVRWLAVNFEIQLFTVIHFYFGADLRHHYRAKT